ncbi:MAG: BMC domain-containing protein [Sporomusaceae bacterium]|nr:BMC domain-containing protein [Sporomusaceae bacterium]
MVKNSLGLIEVVGLAAALEAADAAMKAANVELIGYELTNGGGLVLVKLQGDVGAVKAGVEAGSMAASKVNKVWSTQVIPRPHQQLFCILGQGEILAVKKQPAPIVVIDSQVIETENEMIEKSGTQPELSAEIEEEAEIKVGKEEDHHQEQVAKELSSEVSNGNSECDGLIVIAQKEKKPADICNLCNDPACQRKKGDPKITCIYYVKSN